MSTDSAKAWAQDAMKFWPLVMTIVLGLMGYASLRERVAHGEQEIAALKSQHSNTQSRLSQMETRLAVIDERTIFIRETLIEVKKEVTSKP